MKSTRQHARAFAAAAHRVTPLHAPPPPHASVVAASVARVGITRGCHSARLWIWEFTCMPERLHVPASQPVINFDRAVGRTLSQVVERVGRICSVGHSVRASSSSHLCRWWCQVQYHPGHDTQLAAARPRAALDALVDHAVVRIARPQAAVDARTRLAPDRGAVRSFADPGCATGCLRFDATR